MIGQQADGTLRVERIESEPDPRAAWLEARRSGIGGSDAAAVLGLSPWKSPLALWAEKTGLVTEPNLDELEYIEWGQVLEEPIARKYVQVTGRTLIDPGRFAIRHHPERTWQHCTLDRQIMFLDPEKGDGDLSIKNANAFKAHDWEEEPPLPYQVQLMHELAVTGLQWGSFAVLIGGQKFRWCDFPRNDRFISFLVEKEEEFWDRVQRVDPPSPDASDSTKEVLLRLYPKDTGESIELTLEDGIWVDKLSEARAAKKAAEASEQEAKNMLAAKMKTATLGLLSDGRSLTFKAQHRDSYTVAASDFRVMREVKSKGKK